MRTNDYKSEELGITIDEAIAHANGVAQSQGDLYDCYMQHGEQGDHVHKCLKCSTEHKQLAEWLEQLKRADTLLAAAYDLLQKQYNSRYVLNLLAETIHYDEAECDGNCLMEDIETWMFERGRYKK